MKPISTLATIIMFAIHGVAACREPHSGRVPWEVVAELREAPGNLTVTPAGEVILSLHQHFSPAMRVVALDAADKPTLIPFPDALMAGDSRKVPLALNSVLGIQSDDQGVVWMLDNAMRDGELPKLVGWHTSTDGGSLERVIHFPPHTVPSPSFLNDLAVDRPRGTIYVADTSGAGRPAILVVDVATGLVRRVLENHESVKAEEIPMVAGGDEVRVRMPDGTVVNPKIAVNPIAIDAAGDFLYYGPMTGTRLYRVPTAALRDPGLTEAELGAEVEYYADRPISDGISIDTAGNIYITAVADNAIGVILADTRGYEILI